VLRRPVESAQYLSIRYTERLAEAGGVQSVGSRGDSFDNALAETVIGLYKTELVRNKGPWRVLDDVGVEGETVDDRLAQTRLGEHLGPLPERQVCGHHDRGQLASFIEHLEQELGLWMR
jgi:putative transposase